MDILKILCVDKVYLLDGYRDAPMELSHFYEELFKESSGQN